MTDPGVGAATWSPASGRVEYALRDGAAWITLADGDRGNLIDHESANLLLRAVRQAAHDQARVIVLTATGRFFCAGGDLASFGSVDDVGGYIDDLAETLHRTILELVRSPAVVVSSVHATAAGAGFPLAAAADLVIAARSAKFTLGYTKVGLSPDGGTSLLVHTLGLHLTLRMALLGDVLTAEEAHAAGLVARVVPDDELAAATEAIVAALLAGAPGAQGAVKRLLRETVDPAPERALRAETVSIRTQAGSPEGAEGVRAFLDKRPPDFGASEPAGP